MASGDRDLDLTLSLKVSDPDVTGHLTGEMGFPADQRRRDHVADGEPGALPEHFLF